MKYRLTFQFCDTEKQAAALVELINKESSAYCRKKYPAHYLPWSSSDRKENCFIVWYHTN